MTYIFDAIRLPIGKANGIYKNIIPEELMAFVLKNLLIRNKLYSENIDEVILANAFGTGGNMARFAALSAGFSIENSVFTIDSQCSGGLKSLEIANAYLTSGMKNLIIAGGMESKSFAPTKAYQSQDPRFQLENPFFSTAQFSPNQESEFPLIKAAENVANKYQISKAEMLEWATASHKKASSDFSKNAVESFVVKINEKHEDQSIKGNTDLDKLATENMIDRTVSAHYNDGAAAVLIGNENELLKPIAKILAVESVGCSPVYAQEGVINATDKLLKVANLKIQEIDLFEINESFALIPLIFAKVFGVAKEKINVLGGNLAHGHPFGASGTINLIHLLASLKLKNKKVGLVAIPAAGGQATAMLVEKL
ncbi:thiolase family protein [Lacihabitans sp. LS3-19]|uniref:thiolase family protein n=1 Tax=Lacihabitans sp. LS3-19 TaxID=2487335 RepID=UPI0020CCC1BC|nr:thiolase family protein [Lacihabitans sp. LS3-19]MCP9770017.1 thiolase family protein [Lacihabitans sp. LS3-19]